MSRRLVKQLIFGSFYLVVLAGIFFLFYFFTLKPEPTCFDNRQNQNEQGVDCGGVCPACELKNVLPVRTLPVRFLQAPNGRTSALVEFQNPNPDYGADPLNYSITFFGKDGEVLEEVSRSTVLYAGEIAFRVEPNLDVPFSSVGRAEAVAAIASWRDAASLPKPKVQTRDVKVEGDSSGRARVSVVVKNDNTYALRSLTANVILFNPLASFVGMSHTLVEDLQPLEERAVEIIVPILEGEDSAEELDARFSFEARR